MKRQFVARWLDVDTPWRVETRDRVAYLLRAARSRGDMVHVLGGLGYQIGELRLTVRQSYHNLTLTTIGA